ncbi:MAG: hydrogenase accessory protein HypB, partial [Anaerolineales bacterium]
NKIDLLPYVDFNFEFFSKGLQALNPNVEVIPLSCRSGEGLDKWFAWLRHELDDFKKIYN